MRQLTMPPSHDTHLQTQPYIDVSSTMCVLRSTLHVKLAREDEVASAVLPLGVGVDV